MIQKKFYKIAFVALALLRLVINAVLPLMDKTEARYAEIARLMYETGNWVTPQIDYGVPFWAKPPLSTWLSALSMHVFGVNEFAVRFPAFMLSVIIAILLWYVIKKENKSFYFSAFILFTLPQFLLHAGVVSTDTSLLLGTTLIMVAFWMQINNEKKTIWGYLVFVGAGLGLLAKGPIALILTAPPIVLWVIFNRQYLALWKRIPWISGLILMFAIALPWYLMAESRTEGFIDYFIVGEHFKRFFDSSWKGDKYGFPKSQPLGIVWLFLLGMALPWVQIVFYKLWHDRKNIMKNKWVQFLVFWMLWTPLFFTISKSLIHTYVLPVMPPLALLMIHYWDSFKRKKTAIYVSMILPVAAVIVLIAGCVNHNMEKFSNTDKFVIQNLGEISKPLYYYGNKTYSSQFYSKGKVENLAPEQLDSICSISDSFYILISKRNLKKRKVTLPQGFDEIGESYKAKLFYFDNDKATR